MTQTAIRPEHPRRAHASLAVDTASRTSAPVKWWAAVGAVYLVFMVAVLTHWVLSPLFKTVPVGPTPVPTFMKVAVVFFEVISIPAILACFYFLVIKPLRRDGKLSVDGALTIAFATLWFQDPLSAYSGTWFTYNAWALNYGSWVNSVPYATGKAAPGAMLVEPILIVPGAYVYCFVVAMFAGAWVMRTARNRWPHLSPVKLGAICVAAMFAFDIVLEGVMFMPLGIWEYPGGHFNIFPNTYHKFPLTEMLTAGSAFAAVAILRFFKNDRGETLADRGVESLKVSDRRKSVLRALAMIGFVNMLFFGLYNVANTWTATRMADWPTDLQKRSYLTNGLCGEGTDQMCPGPANPQFRNDNRDPNGGSAHLDPNGHLVVPPNTTLPTMVPFDRGK
jgi:Spirocyclase AveC-like